jgi:DeoR family transcriptional regulator, fructose operon transcriptional repressor
MSMRKERHALLLKALDAGEIDVDDLARRFGVSASTVRRDLQYLSRSHVVYRTYGGAILSDRVTETTLNQRLAMQSDEKHAIARAAINLIEDGDTLILDAGSTITAFGRLLQKRRLRVITNNLSLLPFLAEASDIEVVVLGGALRTNSMSTTGPLAHEALRRMTADRAIVSSDGVVNGRGLSEADLDQVALKSLMMQQSKEVIVLADASKLGRSEQSAWAPLPPRWTLVTDAVASEKQCGEFTGSGARVIVAGARAETKETDCVSKASTIIAT